MSRIRLLLLTPWRTTHASMRWLMLVLMAGGLIVALALGIHTGEPRIWRLGMLICGVGVACAWAFWLSAGMLMAIDARRLRLPGVERSVVLALLLYGAITTLVPTLLMGAFGADALQVALCLALAASAGLAFALLPRWCAMAMGFVPMLVTGLRLHLLLPHWRDAQWQAWGAVALAALLLAIALRWRRLLRVDGDKALGFGGAVVMQYRRQATGNGWAGLQSMDSGQLIRQRPDWLQPCASLRNAGPAAPGRALRIALGGQYLPKTWGSHVRAGGVALLVLPLTLLLVSTLLDLEQIRLSASAVWRAVAPSVAGMAMLFGGLGMALGTDMLLRSRWRRVNAELPLLALLPGLGNAAMQRRQLLRTVLGMPVAALALLLAGALVAASLAQLPAPGRVLLVLAPLAAILNLLASTLCTLGNRTLPRWGEWFYYTLLGALLMLSTLVPILTMDVQPNEAVTQLEKAALLGWAAMAPVMVWFARRGWRAFQHRPHPFLPTLG